MVGGGARILSNRWARALVLKGNFSTLLLVVALSGVLVACSSNKAKVPPLLQGARADDPSIKVASFYAKGTGLLPYDTIAEAYWQTDGDRILWTKGFVRYSGL